MENNSQTLLIAALVIALVALGLSIHSVYTITKINKQLVEVEKILPVIEKIEPLVPQLEILNESLPEIEYYLLNLPPVPSE